MQSRLNFPFVGIPTFLRAPYQPDWGAVGADVAVIGIPTDEGSPFMPGSRFGPRSIREHSLRFGGEAPGYYDPEERRRHLDSFLTEQRLVDVGDVDILPTNVEGTFANVTAAIAQLHGRGAMPLVLGGDHSITFPVVRALAGEDLYVVHFDAHLDYMPFVHGISMSNQNAFRHIAQMSHVRQLIQVGIRSLRNTEAMMADSLKDGNRVVTMGEYLAGEPEALVAGIPEGAACYISLDIDVLDMSLVPGCVSAEPSGMTYQQLSRSLRALAERTEVVGVDLVEVNPQLDVATGVTSYLAAHLLVELLGRVCDSPDWRRRRARRRAAA